MNFPACDSKLPYETPFICFIARCPLAQESLLLRGVFSRRLHQTSKLLNMSADGAGVVKQRAAAFYERHPVDAPVVTIALTHLPTAGPRSRKYFGYWRTYTAFMEKSAAIFDLDTKKVCRNRVLNPRKHLIVLSILPSGVSIHTLTAFPAGMSCLSIPCWRIEGKYC